MKWYADAVAPDGSGFIAYHAELRWRSAALRLASVMRIPPHGPPCTSTARARAAPRLEDGVLVWPPSRLLPGARWESRQRAFEAPLLERGGRRLTWFCAAPAARVSVGGADAGLGYAERIETTLAPWNLPIGELRWGRFVSESASLVWIDWQGPHPLRLVFHDGVLAERAAVDGARVSTVSSILSVGAPRVLRDGPLGSTALGTIPLLRGSLPARLLALHETKWLCPGTLHDRHGTHEGWVVHEVVRWP